MSRGEGRYVTALACDACRVNWPNYARFTHCPECRAATHRVSVPCTEVVDYEEAIWRANRNAQSAQRIERTAQINERFIEVIRAGLTVDDLIHFDRLASEFD